MPTPPEPQEEGGAAGATQENVALEFWGTAEPGMMQPDLDVWNAEHPDMQVTYLFTPNVSAVGTNPKFLAATLGGDPPDVIWHDGSNYVTSASLNAFEELVDVSSIDEMSIILYFEGFWY
jgi:ABC-type glycerol-3-phosphate transport system substrate-binding protein